MAQGQIQTHTLTYTILKTVGEVSDNKIKRICEKGFSIVNVVSGQFAQFIHNKSNGALLVMQNQISYVPAPMKIEETLENSGIVVEIFTNILDILLLDGNVNINIAMDRSYPSDLNTFQKSLSFLSADFASKLGANAIGLRIPFNKDDFQGEIRIEPYFASADRYFLGTNIQSKQACLIGESTQKWSDLKNIITQEFEPLVKSLFED